MPIINIKMAKGRGVHGQVLDNKSLHVIHLSYKIWTMRSKIIETLREEERASFLNLSPLDRILRMERLLYEIIAIRAADEGIAEGEIYNRYLERDKRRHR